MFYGQYSWTAEVGEIVIHVGFGHDHKYGLETIETITDNGVEIMDRGFAFYERFKELKEKTSHCLQINSKISVCAA